MDRFVAAAKAGGLKVVMNLSEYGWALNQSGIKGVNQDWGPYLQFVTNRVNTVTGVAYRDESAIAGWELWGEISAPNYGSDPMRGTTAETTEFFRRTLGQLQPMVPKHVVSTGGFSYLNDPGSGIDWRTIVSLKDNDTCDMEINSGDDRDVTTAMFTDFCQDLAKPWRLAAFSSCQGAAHFPGDINHWPTDTQMAAHHRDMYAIARGGAPATYPAAGAHFWNLRDEPARNDQCSIGHQYPRTLTEVQAFPT